MRLYLIWFGVVLSATCILLLIAEISAGSDWSAGFLLITHVLIMTGYLYLLSEKGG